MSDFSEVDERFDNEIRPYLMARMDGLLSGKERDLDKLKSFLHQELERKEREFGGCTKCYGKGYSTERVGDETVEPDFVGDKRYILRHAHIEYIPCTCDRGKQIKELLDSQNK